ncbi:MAG TPA: UDP-N-acetylmuramoyl-L-alanyl-D-glutamate--2,6-diaminopimelate ligase [Patescibacteria group bacterium]|jgi:UDP-N-acetylmuramoyl-L-alanyl-D-glutamate--2,6-diaminopimelate ligase|nr:UDP-N-acetylmuramoyl-L-alanyl-D-glutamate--2,6-diaminopimelate ligase [Patescibacteria group bacterium]
MSLRTLVKKFIPSKLFVKIEPFGHLMEAVLFNVLYGFPARKMKVIGVTGTNGKTTTSFMIYKILQAAGYKVGIMTTVAFGVDDDIKPQTHHVTSVTVPELMKRLKEFKSKNIDWLVLETTSHALAQNRVWGVPYSVVVMTNVTHEHLDFHKTFNNYLNAKIKLFQLANGNKKGLRTGIINAEDDNAPKFVSAINKPITYGVKTGDLRAEEVILATDQIQYTAKIGSTNYHIKCFIPGSFNVYNSLAAVAVGHVLSVPVGKIEQGIAALKEVEGRMTHINEGQPFDVIVDFAHTPDSFEKLFKDIKPVTNAKLIVMFGSAGRRDEAKRSIQGELAGIYADEVVITEEDDRDVDGDKILNQIAGGAEKAGKTRQTNLFLVHDRPAAIQFTIDRAKTGDTVLLLGKGHEKTIERANGASPWDEIGAAREAIKKRLAKS